MRVFAPIATGRRLGATLLGVTFLGLAGCLDLNPNVEACSVTIAPTVISVPVNGRVPVVGTAFDCKGASISSNRKRVNFSTANSAIATVSSEGIVIGIAPGQTTISAVADGKTGTAQLTVTAEVANAVTVTPTNPTIRVAETRPFTASVRNAAGTIITGRTVRWSSSNSAIASVSSDGQVTANAPGVVSIAAEVDQVVGTTQVQVTLIPLGFCSLTPTSQRLTVSAGFQPTLVLRDTANRVVEAANRQIAWSSNNQVVAVVSQSGLITAVRAGTARIRATSVETPAVNCEIAIDVADARIASAQITTIGGFIRIGVPRQLQVALRDSLNQPIQGARPVVWTSVNPAVATVNQQGVVIGVSEGTARIAVNAEGAVDTVSYTVNKIPVGRIDITPLQSTVTQGATVQLTATVRDSAGTIVTDRVVTWLTGNPAIATVSNTGLVTTLAAGTVGISAQSENVGAQAASVTVNPQAVATIAAPATFSLARGTVSAFTITVRDATGRELFGRTVLTTSDLPAIANVAQATNTSQVQVSGVREGTATITLQAINAQGNAEGAPTRVTVTVTAPTTGNIVRANSTSAVKK